MVKCEHDEGLETINFISVFIILRCQEEEEEEDTRKKKFLYFACRNVGRCSLGICSQAFCECLPFGHPYESSYMFGVEIWGYTKRGYNLDNQFLDIRNVFRYACNLMMYSTII